MPRMDADSILEAVARGAMGVPEARKRLALHL